MHDLWAVNVHTRTVTELQPLLPLPSGRQAHAYAGSACFLYIFGGHSSHFPHACAHSL